uniref:Uncharacterized protein n=1 Tax=Sinocyclocheilus grahami TaxID=75366 RepID=A0A672TDF6_SINGR
LKKYGTCFKIDLLHISCDMLCVCVSLYVHLYLMYTAEKLPIILGHLAGQIFRAHQLKTGHRASLLCSPSLVQVHNEKYLLKMYSPSGHPSCRRVCFFIRTFSDEETYHEI